MICENEHKWIVFMEQIGRHADNPNKPIFNAYWLCSECKKRMDLKEKKFRNHHDILVPWREGLTLLKGEK